MKRFDVNIPPACTQILSQYHRKIVLPKHFPFGDISRVISIIFKVAVVCTAEKICRLKPKQGILGIDRSEGMLNVARRKVADAGLADAIAFETGDCLNLRFADGSFDAVTVAYGVRNFEHLDQGYAEMHRVLAKGGVLCVVELSTPTGWLTRKLYDLYTLHIIPLVGRLVSHDVRAYRYLPESIAAVPQGEAMLGIMRAAGFTECSFKALTFGTCTIYLATK